MLPIYSHCLKMTLKCYGPSHIRRQYYERALISSKVVFSTKHVSLKWVKMFHLMIRTCCNCSKPFPIIPTQHQFWVNFELTFLIDKPKSKSNLYWNYKSNFIWIIQLDSRSRDINDVVVSRIIDILSLKEFHDFNPGGCNIAPPSAYSVYTSKISFESLNTLWIQVHHN